ncbi:MAG: GNAT family N-acetyltransferase [Adlercreutzia sp.]|nr:GNAT family N-acetyltransferase [Adlercreutzia sp.]
MLIRRYVSEDCEATALLFRGTIEEVCAGDYTPDQLHAWQSGCSDLGVWNASLLASSALVAVLEGAIAGFGDITDDGYLDRLFVHKGYQRIGIGTALCDALEALVPGDVTTHASITAVPFFEARGYERLDENVVEREGERLTNYAMVKRRP